MFFLLRFCRLQSQKPLKRYVSPLFLFAFSPFEESYNPFKLQCQGKGQRFLKLFAWSLQIRWHWFSKLSNKTSWQYWPSMLSKLGALCSSWLGTFVLSPYYCQFQSRTHPVIAHLSQRQSRHVKLALLQHVLFGAWWQVGVLIWVRSYFLVGHSTYGQRSLCGIGGRREWFRLISQDS